jgi:hypothetical protein
MAISVDTVYQRVLVLSNKEQRGYITPQEFNLLANQAQQQIFEQYFYDLNQRLRIEPESPGVRGEEDLSVFLNEKISHHISIGTVTSGVTFPANYMIGRIFVDENNFRYPCEKLPRNEVLNIIKSSRHLGLLARSPIYCDSITGNDIEVYNNTGQLTGSPAVKCEVINKPTDTVWGYTVVNGKALYNSATTTNFDMHDSEETNLVIKILELAGITLNKPGLAQTAGQKDINETQLKKQ